MECYVCAGDVGIGRGNEGPGSLTAPVHSDTTVENVGATLPPAAVVAPIPGT